MLIANWKFARLPRLIESATAKTDFQIATAKMFDSNWDCVEYFFFLMLKNTLLGGTTSWREFFLRQVFTALRSTRWSCPFDTVLRVFSSYNYFSGQQWQYFLHLFVTLRDSRERNCYVRMNRTKIILFLIKFYSTLLLFTPQNLLFLHFFSKNSSSAGNTTHHDIFHRSSDGQREHDFWGKRWSFIECFLKIFIIECFFFKIFYSTRDRRMIAPFLF